MHFAFRRLSFWKKSPPDVPGGRCRHAVLAAALADAKRTGSYLLTYAAVQIVSIVTAQRVPPDVSITYIGAS